MSRPFVEQADKPSRTSESTRCGNFKTTAKGAFSDKAGGAVAARWQGRAFGSDPTRAVVGLGRWDSQREQVLPSRAGVELGGSLG